MKTIIISLLISLIAYIYFQKQKYIELPDIKDDSHDVSVFKFDEN